jgi:uncharacterized RDD family membrane protein YckC
VVDSHAGLVTRVSAIVVDILLLTGAVLVVGGLPPAATTAVLGHSPYWLSRACALAGAVLPWFYFTLSWWLTGATVGDLVFGVRVRRPGGARVSPLRAALRAAIGLTFAPVWTVGLLYILVDRRRRALHDVVFGTVVCFTRPTRRRLVTQSR